MLEENDANKSRVGTSEPPYCQAKVAISTTSVRKVHRTVQQVSR
ncbi:uncharacterized protein An09g04420 [Aspergillus niger]|uniref:Contig An09c0110, genomic contig n=2 Tax=Aspergillus niger TaxID=5061 RepID=A2QU53_ASPNC|nr:uncharacterized protein An09g04420 [Aspergillus niger]CAK40296.1 unnamed protein product [Aspergillus niger]